MIAKQEKNYKNTKHEKFENIFNGKIWFILGLKYFVYKIIFNT